MKLHSVTMRRTVHPVGLAVALLLTIGCEGALSLNVEARKTLDTSQVITAEDANLNDVPYQISIESLGLHRCGGAIISEDWVITPAHCIDPRVSGETSFKRIRSGSITSIPVVGGGGELHQIADLKIHHRWDVNTLDYDVGLIQVSNKFVYSDEVKPVTLNQLGFFEGLILDYDEKVRVTGWGVTRPGGLVPAWRLKVAEIPLIRRARCSERFKRAPAGTANITLRMLCGTNLGNAGPCQGDSGGLLIHRDRLVGLASWTIAGCSDPTYPTIFTNIVNYDIRDFIQDITGL